MLNLENSQLVVFIGLVFAFMIMQGLLNLSMLMYIRASGRESSALNRETFGLVKKLEGLTATKREQMLLHIDKLLEDLEISLPNSISKEAGQRIYEVESRILSRLAELEQLLEKDPYSKQKIEDLIKSVEGMERSVITAAAQQAKKVVLDNRNSLFACEMGGEREPLVLTGLKVGQ